MDKTNSTLAERVLLKIQEQHLAPKPRWHFVVSETVVWSVAGLSLVVGSIASALTFYILNASRAVEHAVYFSSWRGFFGALPYVWLGLVAVGLFYSLYAFRHTQKGYRFHPTLIVGVAVVLSMVMGGCLHATGFTGSIDRYLLAALPSYGPLAGYRPEHWMSVEDGFLVGHVVAMNTDLLMLRDLEGLTWTVVLSEVSRMPPLALEEGVPVRIWGTTTGDTLFEAHDIRPWRGRGPGMGRRGGPRGMMGAPGQEIRTPLSE